MVAGPLEVPANLVAEVVGRGVEPLMQRLVTIDRQLQRVGNEVELTTPKGEKARTIMVPRSVTLELRRHLRDHSPDGLLFHGRFGDGLRHDVFYTHGWRPALVAAGLEPNAYVFHSLRHWCASSMLAENTNPAAVAGYLGDTFETLQRVYAHWMTEDRAVPAEVLERLLVSTSEEPAAEPRTRHLGHPNGTRSGHATVLEPENRPISPGQSPWWW